MMDHPHHIKPLRLPPGEATNFAFDLGLDKPADINVEGFGWRVASIANSNKDSLKAAGYSVMQNNVGDWLVCYTPHHSQSENRTSSEPSQVVSEIQRASAIGDSPYHERVRRGRGKVISA